MSTSILSAGFSYFLDIEDWAYYGLFAFSATFAVYNGQRLIKSAQPTKTPWLNWVQRNEKWLIITVFSSSVFTLGALLLIGKIGWMSSTFLSISGLVSFFYVVKIKGKNMREIAYIKIHLISFSWVTVLILFPALNEGIFNESLVWMAIAHYAYVIGVTIPFDIRDLKFDSKSQMTIPQVVGKFWAKASSVVLLLAFSGIMIWQQPDLLYNLLFHIAVAVQLTLVIFMNERHGDIYCAGAIDGSIALLGASYFLMV